MTTDAETAARSVPERIESLLRGRLEGDVRVDGYTRHLYSADASMYRIEPLAVVFPRTEADVVTVVDIANQLDVPVLARGAGTSLAGQTVGRSVVIDFSRYMNQILEIDPLARRAVVQPGVVQDQLNRAVARHGLMFGPDTSTSNRATIGGMIGNNSAGSHSIQYGSTIDHVLGLRAVLADGAVVDIAPVPPDAPADATHPLSRLRRGVEDILRRNGDALASLPPFWRHSGGYRIDRVLAGDQLDLAQLIVGSEGTLAVVTQAIVNLVAAPAERVIAVGHFATTLEAVRATDDALAVEPASIELMDRKILALAAQRIEYAGLSRHLEGDPGALLFVEICADDRAHALRRLDDLAALWAAHGHGYFTLKAVTGDQQAELLKVRKASLGLLMAASTGTRRPLAFIEDTAVPPDRLPDYVTGFERILARHGLDAGIYGHCSVGCLHIRPYLDLSVEGQPELMRTVAEEISELVMHFGGVNSSEHGDGLARSEFNRKLFGPQLYEAMREVKRLFDPRGRLNPGKIIDAPPMTENLRDAVAVRPGPLRTVLNFAGDAGMRGAADRCMNIGLCRKDGSGVMCPSYMATREEEHATRGRAMALSKALSSPDPRAALGDERLHDILDLCLECKACKSECPLGIDMAALKSETLHQYHQTHGVPMRSRLFGGIRTLNRLGSATAPVSNWALSSRISRSVLERVFGISGRRPMPAFRRDTVLRRRPASRVRPGTRGEVVLLTDSFTTYSEPEIGRAAVDLLEAAGWSVHLSGNDCCGRANISKGMLDKAQAKAKAMLDHLAPFAERGVKIVGLEPSCLLTLKDEYGSLLPDDERARIVADAAVLLPELLVEAIDAGWLSLRPNSELSGKRIVFHGHCHEKAIVGTAGSRSLLERIPGASVYELDAGCCGMAGSFGFEREHVELSLQIGGQRLFPALSAEPADSVIAASGTSCRAQIAHGVERTARHPVELVRLALGP